MSLKADLKQVLAGEVDDAASTLEASFHDASLFEVVPQVVTYPKDAQDVQNLVKYVAANKDKQPSLSLTARSAGTDMSGGAINRFIIVDFNRHFTRFTRSARQEAHAQPGVFYRDFENATLQHNALMPSYPA